MRIALSTLSALAVSTFVVLSAWGGADDAALRSNDPAVAGPALFGAWTEAVKAGDGLRLWPLLRPETRRGIRAEADALREEMIKKPELKTRVQKLLGIDKDPVTLDPDEFAQRVAGVMARERAEHSLRYFGEAFESAHREGALLIVVSRAPKQRAAEYPLGLLEASFRRVDGAWVHDEDAGHPYRSRLIESMPAHQPVQIDQLDFVGPSGPLLVTRRDKLEVVPWKQEGKTTSIPLQGMLPVLDRKARWVAFVVGTLGEEAIQIWSIDEGKHLRTLPAKYAGSLIAPGDGRTLIAKANLDGVAGLYRWDVTTGEVALLFEENVSLGGAALIDRGTKIAASAYKKLVVVDLEGKLLKEIPTPEDAEDQLFGDPQHARFAVRCVPAGHESGPLVVVDAETGAQVARLGSRVGFRATAFSPDGSQLAFEEQGTIRRYSTATWELIGTHGDLAHSCEFTWHPSGTCIVAAGFVRDTDVKDRHRFFVYSALEAGGVR